MPPIETQIWKRTALFRSRTPKLLKACYEQQNHLCDLCGLRIQDWTYAELDHSIPISQFARGPLTDEEALNQVNSSNNLRAVHFLCNREKCGRTREEWFAQGLNKKIDEQRIKLSEDNLYSSLRIRKLLRRNLYEYFQRADKTPIPRFKYPEGRCYYPCELIDNRLTLDKLISQLDERSKLLTRLKLEKGI